MIHAKGMHMWQVALPGCVAHHVCCMMLHSADSFQIFLCGALCAPLGLAIASMTAEHGCFKLSFDLCGSQ